MIGRNNTEKNRGSEVKFDLGSNPSALGELVNINLSFPTHKMRLIPFPTKGN